MLIGKLFRLVGSFQASKACSRRTVARRWSGLRTWSANRRTRWKKRPRRVNHDKRPATTAAGTATWPATVRSLRRGTSVVAPRASAPGGRKTSKPTNSSWPNVWLNRPRNSSRATPRRRNSRPTHRPRPKAPSAVCCSATKEWPAAVASTPVIVVAVPVTDSRPIRSIRCLEWAGGITVAAGAAEICSRRVKSVDHIVYNQSINHTRSQCIYTCTY